MLMYTNLALLITLMFAANYGNCANREVFGELLAEQLIGRVKEPFADGSRSRIVTEVIGWVPTEAESSADRLSYDVTMKVCEINYIELTEPVVGPKSRCQTCESTVTVRGKPFEILEEMDNGCDDGSSDDSDGELRSIFEKFVKKYDKTYDDEEVKERRFRIFQENLSRIERLRKAETGTAKYGITEFFDLTEEEFIRFYTGYRPDLDYHHQSTIHVPNDEPLSNGFDWREKDAVSPVKNQGKCGSCWAFVTTGVLESQYAITYKKNISLSEQELVDCDKRDKGCNGGSIVNAYSAIMFDLGGMEQESDYPYNATREKCNLHEEKFVVRVSSYRSFSPNEKRIATALKKFGPIAAAVDSLLLHDYKGGIISNECGYDIDHGILIVGYGQENNPQNGQALPYWIIKNSWGTKWGEDGYFRLRRGVNLCGIAEFPSIAFLEEPE